MNLINTEAEVILVHTLINKFKIYMNQEVYRANLDRELQVMVVHPIELECKDVIKNKLPSNCAISTEYITNVK